MIRVILFDIDGTLMHSGGAGRMAMVQAFEEVFGIPDAFDGIGMSGKTDPQILNEAFEKHGLTGDPVKNEQFKHRYFELLQENIRMDLPLKRVFPGVKELLERLHREKEVLVGLLTGNWEQGARIKLGYFGLWDYFPFGAFGDDSMDRNELLPFAIRRAERLLDARGRPAPIAPKRAVVIGDTPSDVRCAKVHGAKAVAVATGSYSKAQLESAGADLVLENLEKPAKILDWIWQV
jgi:phosphoglycolate phosphatase-like HAD superfamily hydrolase